MNKFLLLVLFVLYTGAINAQNYNQNTKFLKGNSVWTFGKKAGYNFNNGSSFVTPMQSEEGCASVANRSNGQLLFYSDGKSCWNKNHVAMTQANGSLLGNNLNNGTTAQGVCIVPFVSDSNKYYVFSLQPQGGYALTTSRGKLYYSVVDMSLNNGLGNVVATQKNILMDSLLGESMIAVPGNNCDIWLIVHQTDTSLFKAYHITASGIDPNPVLSSAGAQITGVNTYVMTWFGQLTEYLYGAYMVGTMAISPDRSKLAITSKIPGLGTLSAYENLVQGSLVCEFDATTGTVSNAILLDTIGCYGAAFSPDNSKLYVTTAVSAPPIGSVIAQYDISSFNAAAVNASRFQVAQMNVSAYGLKLYNDTVYMAYGGSSASTPLFHRINNPNLSGLACNYQANALSLAPTTSCNFMLNNEVVYPYPADTTKVTRLDTALCDAAWENLVLQADAGFTSYLWDDGSIGNSRTISHSGSYWVLCKDDCHSFIDSFVITPLPPDTVATVKLDTLICQAFQDITLVANSGFEGYMWDDGSTAANRVITTWGTYWVLCKDSCLSVADTFIIRGADMSFDLGADTTLCSPEKLTLEVPINDGVYLWQDGSTSSSYLADHPGSYSVNVNKNGCEATDQINVQYLDVRQALGTDVLVCIGEPFTLSLMAQVPAGSEVKWSGGQTTPAITVSDTGIYFVTVSNQQCSGSDTMLVAYKVCECAYLMPNAFSPNGDGKNDLYKPEIQPGCVIRNFVLNIYNRWGQRIYSSPNPDNGWDGYSGNVTADAGTYYYELRFEGGSRKIQYYQKGDLALIR